MGSLPQDKKNYPKYYKKMKQVTNENQKTKGSTLTPLPASYLDSLLKSRHDAGGGSSSKSFLDNKIASTFARNNYYINIF